MTSLDWFITIGSFGCFVGAYAVFCIEASRRISSGGTSLGAANSRPTPLCVKPKVPGRHPDCGDLTRTHATNGSRPGRISQPLAYWLVFHRSIT